MNPRTAIARAERQCDSAPAPRRLGLALVLVREVRGVCRSAGAGEPPKVGGLVRSGMMICIGRARPGVAGGVRSVERFAPGLSKAEEGIGGTGGIETESCWGGGGECERARSRCERDTEGVRR